MMEVRSHYSGLHGLCNSAKYALSLCTFVRGGCFTKLSLLSSQKFCLTKRTSRGPARMHRFARFSASTLIGLFAFLQSATANPVPLKSLPMVFEQNQGQTASEYRYLLHRDGMSVLFLPGGADFRLPHKGVRSSEVHLRLVGTQVSPAGIALQAGHANYLLGSDALKWIRNVPQFGRVEYPELYPGISLIFYGNGDSLEHDFVLQAGADPAQIAFRLSGAQAVELNAHGDLVVRLDAGNLLLRRPVAYQEAGNDRTKVNASFVLANDGTIGFRVGRYDRAHPLVIDPVFTFSTYLAGTGSDQIAAVATDGSGNIYAVGSTSSSDFPTANAEQPHLGGCDPFAGCDNVFVSKLDPTGHTLLYSTYLGGSGKDLGRAIAIDTHGNAIVSGIAGSADFPRVGNIPGTNCAVNSSCYFLASLKTDGSALNYSGVIQAIEGDYTNGVDGRVAVDASGSAYFTGISGGPNFPVTAGTLTTTPGNPYNNTFLLKVDATGKVQYSTIIPGNAAIDPIKVHNNWFLPTGIAVNANGQATIAGTAGMGLPSTSGVIQPTFPNNPAIGADTAGFVLQLNASASAINFASYLPGTDFTGGMAVDAAGNYYLAGYTNETDLPVSSNAYQKAILPGQNCTCNDGYILKLNPQATSVLAATYLGGTPAVGNEGTNFSGIAVDSHSNIFVGGFTASVDFPLKDPFATTYESTTSVADMILAEMSSDLSGLLFGSFLSSTTSQLSGSIFSGLAVDKSDKLIVAGITYASDYPTTDGSVEPKPPPPANPQSSPPHSFLSKIDLSIGAPSVCLSSESVGFGNVPAQTTGTQSLTLTNCGNAPLHLDSYVSSSPLVGAPGNCSDVAADAACTITVSYLPENSDSVSGTLTLSDNAAIPIQVVSFSGQGLAGKLVPRPTPLDFGHLLLGTHGPQTNLTLSNAGTSDLTISAVSVSGDYTISANTCTATLTKGWFCTVTLIFAPSVSGTRTGALVIHSNDPESPQLTVPLTGVGDTQYATASITSIDPPALQVGAASQKLQITGTNFYPESVVNVHGAPQTTTFVSNTSLTATLDAASLTGIGEVPVTVANPAPGGGTGNAVTLTPYQTVQLAASALLSVNGTLYASIPASSLTDPNTILPINPITGKLGTPISVGNDPQKMAASDDGKYIYVYVAGDGTIQRVNLKTSAVERTFSFPSESWISSAQGVNDMHVVPGADQSLVVAFNSILALYNDTGLLSTTPNSYPGLNVPSFTFATDSATFYGLPLDFTSNAPEVYTLDGSGIHTTVPSGRINGNDGTGGFAIISDGTLLYTTDGSEWDAKTGKLLGKFTAPIFNQNSAPDAAAIAVDHGSGGRMFFLGDESYNNGSALILSSFDKQTFKNIGYLPFEGVDWPASSNLTIWGTNGFAFIAPGIGLTDQEIYILSSSLNANPTQNPQPAIATISPAAAVAGGGAFTLTVNGSGYTNTSTVTWNLTPRTTTFVNDKQLTVAISAADIAEAGTVYVGVVNPAPGGGASALLNFTITPHAGQLSFSPGALDFGSQGVGTTSAKQAVTVSNPGDQPVSIASVSASDGFAETDTCGGVLAPAATCTVNVTFTPATANAQTGTLTFADSAASSPQTVALSGTGVASGFTIGAASGGSTSATVTNGQTATYSLSLTGSAGTSGTVTLACTGAPAGATCTIAPATLNLVSGKASSFMVSVSTRGSSTSARVVRTSIAGFGLLAVLLPFFWKRRVRAIYLAILLVSAGAGAAMLSGCGGSQSSSPPAPSSNVAPGTYTLKIIATEGSVTATQNLSLTVQ
jgi:hypothetical protein